MTSSGSSCEISQRVPPVEPNYGRCHRPMTGQYSASRCRSLERSSAAPGGHRRALQTPGKMTILKQSSSAPSQSARRAADLHHVGGVAPYLARDPRDLFEACAPREDQSAPASGRGSHARSHRRARSGTGVRAAMMTGSDRSVPTPPDPGEPGPRRSACRRGVRTSSARTDIQGAGGHAGLLIRTVAPVQRIPVAVPRREERRRCSSPVARVGGHLGSG